MGLGFRGFGGFIRYPEDFFSQQKEHEDFVVGNVKTCRLKGETAYLTNWNMLLESARGFFGTAFKGALTFRGIHGPILR